MDRESERSRSIPLAKPVSRSSKIKDVGLPLLVLKLDDHFDDNCVSCFIHSNLTSITGYFGKTVPRYLPYDFKHHVCQNRVTKRTFQILSGSIVS